MRHGPARERAPLHQQKSGKSPPFSSQLPDRYLAVPSPAATPGPDPASSPAEAALATLAPSGRSAAPDVATLHLSKSGKMPCFWHPSDQLSHSAIGESPKVAAGGRLRRPLRGRCGGRQQAGRLRARRRAHCREASVPCTGAGEMRPPGRGRDGPVIESAELAAVGERWPGGERAGSRSPPGGCAIAVPRLDCRAGCSIKRAASGGWFTDYPRFAAASQTRTSYHQTALDRTQHHSAALNRTGFHC
jgi:hypothetical protein